MIWVGKMRGRIGNPKQKLRGDRKKRELYTSGHYNENNKNYLLEKNNINNFRANQLPGATRKTMYGATDLTLQRKTTRIILINNTNNLSQQHCAQNNTLGAQGDLLKTMVVNTIVN